MISLRYYLDTRRPSHRPDGKFPLKLAVTKRGDTALLSVSAWATREEWDAKAQRVRGGRFGRSGELNDYLARLMLKFEDAVRALTLDGDGPAMTATQVRDHLAGRIFDAPPGMTLGQYFAGFEGRGGENTRRTFENARKAAERALPGIMERPLASVTTRDVARIDAEFRATCKPSTRNTYASKLRQVLRAPPRGTDCGGRRAGAEDRRGGDALAGAHRRPDARLYGAAPRRAARRRGAGLLPALVLPPGD